MIARAAGFVSTHIVSAAVVLPVAGALATLFIGSRWRRAARIVAAVVSAASAALCFTAFSMLRGSGEIELRDAAPWIPALGIYYRVGLDGVSALFASATSSCCFASIIYSMRRPSPREGTMLALILFAQASLTGIFASFDAFLFYLFWNAAALSACFVLGMWGGGGRIAAAVKLMAFAAASSAAMLLVFAFAGARAESFYIVDWMAHRFPVFDQVWMFWALALAFGTFVPVAGLHTWLADSSEQATPAGAALFGGTMLAAGAYGLFRIGMPIAPVAVALFAPAMCALAVAAVFIGAMLALAEKDLMRVVASASISQMGLVLLGLFSLQALGASGAVLLAAAGTLMSCGLYMVAGTLRERAQGPDAAQAGGIARPMPAASAALALFAAAAVGLPGLAGFSGQFPLMLGSFQVRTFHAAAALAGIALLASVLAAKVAAILFGRREQADDRRFSDAGAAEISGMAPLVALIILIGLWPRPVLDRLARPAEAFVKLSKRVEMIIPVKGVAPADEPGGAGRVR